MTRRFLVTGGAGFIGSHLARRLLARGHAVRVLDDLSSGSRRNVPPGAEFVRGDIRDPRAVARAFRRVDGCFHLAAVASVARSIEDPEGTHAVNLGGTVRIFAAAQRGGTPVVYASSAAVYGDNARLPLAESAPARPLSPYAADKAGAELHAAAARAQGFASVGLRFFNVYGPGQDPRSPYSGVISIFADRLRQDRPLVVYGTGRQSRDFVYVGDVTALACRAMARARTSPPVLNVCTGRATTLLELIRALQQAAGRAVPIRFEPGRPGEVFASRGSPARAWRALGLRPSTPLHSGLRRLLASL